MTKEDSNRLGVVLGNGIGGLPDTEEQCEVMNNKGGMRVSPFFIPMILPNMAAANVSRLIGLRGYSSTVITACAAGTQGIGEGFEVIRRGLADVVFSGGTEAGITKLALSGFSVIRALTSRNENPEKAIEVIEYSQNLNSSLYEVKGDAQEQLGQFSQAKLSYLKALESTQSQSIQALLKMKLANLDN